MHTELALYRAMDYVDRACNQDYTTAKDMQQVRLLLEHSQGSRSAMIDALCHREYYFRENPHYGGSSGAAMWIMPKGFYWTIKYVHHSHFVYDVLGLQYLECEALGWIHLSDGRADAYTERTSYQERRVAELEAAGHVRTRNYKERGDSYYKARIPHDHYGNAYVRMDKMRKPDYDWRDPSNWSKPLNENSTFMRDTQSFLDDLAHNAAYPA